MKFNKRDGRLTLRYEELPSRVKETSDKIKVKRHGVDCYGRCCVWYDENKIYRVECENCGMLVMYTADSHDQAMKIWNCIADRFPVV